MSNIEFRDSVGFTAGVSYERRRIGEVIRQRITTLRHYSELGLEPAHAIRTAQELLPGKTVGALVAELGLLATAIEEAADALDQLVDDQG